MEQFTSAESATISHWNSERVSSRPPSKLLGIEMIRFLSAMAVLLWHYQHFALVGNGSVSLAQDREPFYGLLYLFYHYGFLAVQVFWCTSGFIFFYKYRQSISAQQIGGRKFFLLRFSRLYPLHFATLLLVAAMQPVYQHLNGSYFVYQHNDLTHFVSQLFFASSWGLIDSRSFNEPIWSVSVEVIAYLVFFVVLRYVGKAIGIHIAVLATSGILILGLSILAPGQFAVPLCIFLFYLGGLTAIGSQAASRRVRRWLGTSALLALPVSLLIGWRLASVDHRLVLGLLMTFSLPALLYCAARINSRNIWIQKIIEGAGNLTYSSYLLQFPIQLAIAIGFSLSGFAVPMYDVRFWLAYLAVTLLISFLVYRYFESPMQALIRARFGATRQRRALTERLPVELAESANALE